MNDINHMWIMSENQLYKNMWQWLNDVDKINQSLKQKEENK